MSAGRMFSTRRTTPTLFLVLIVSDCLFLLHAQQAVELPAQSAITQQLAQNFSFASDGPVGPGWTRPDEIARTYFHEQLPALFRRTIALSADVPARGKLSWIFTGPHAGFTVELTSSKVRLTQRFYDSTALYSGQGNYPEKIVRDDERQYSGQAREMTVVVDAHLSVQVLLNGRVVLQQACVFDVTRHQLMFSGPRTEHLVVDGKLLAESLGNASIVVNGSKAHQTMIGFGGSPSIPAYLQLSDAGKKQYWELLRHYNLLLHREYPMGTQLKPDLSNLEDLRDATPHYYGDNFPNGEVSNFDYSRHILELGGEVIYEMWALPKWATQAYMATGKPIIDAWGKPVRTAAKPDEYARIVVHYCQLAKERTGAPPAIVGIENEVEQPPEVFTAMTVTLRRALDKAGFQSVKIHMADASYMYLGAGRARELQKDAQGWAAMDYTATHEYDYQEFLTNPDMFDERLRAMNAASGGKPFLATEICINDPHYQEPSYRIALNVAQLYQKNLTELDASALMYCWLLLDVEEPTFGGSRSLLVLDRTRGEIPVASSFELRTLGAFSRHILKGMKRVETVSSNADLLTSAFEDGSKATLIVLNRSTEPQKIDVQWAGRRWTEIERTSLASENETSASLPKNIVVQPGEIVTLSTFAAN
ncbi:MAG TPA: glycoside hydrolase family 30 beta sandwich domain-containing protein [Acidobacteriaceae bacterium]